MAEPDSVLNKLATLLSDTMGQETGRIYRRFYQTDNTQAMVAGAKAVLQELMGAQRASQKIDEAIKKS